MNKKRWLTVGVILGLLAGGFLLAGAQVPEGLLMPLQPLLETYEIIQTRYIEKVDPSKLVEGAVKGMIESLGDPYSSWIGPSEYERREMIQEGKLGGLGIRIRTGDGLPAIVDVLEGSPAERAGLRVRDQISAVDGRSTEEIALEEVANRLRGRVGTPVSVTVRREGKPLEFTLTRAIIRDFTIRTSTLDEEVGYLHIVDFQSGNTAQSVREALDEFREEKITALVLDLRDNGGGLLTQAVEVADEFLNSGKIVSHEGRGPTGPQVYYAEHGEALPDIPLAVLINNRSASASEIVAGALKDHARGILVGTNSFGKRKVQETFPLPNGGAISLTVARYYLPSGDTIKETGIVPDITVEVFQPTEEEKRTLADLEESNTIKSFLDDHPQWEREDLRPLMRKLNQEGIEVDGELLRRFLREEDRDKENDFLNDLQLLRAWEVLKTRQ